jgi:lysophospholipase L1-like esterase
MGGNLVLKHSYVVALGLLAAGNWFSEATLAAEPPATMDSTRETGKLPQASPAESMAIPAVRPSLPPLPRAMAYLPAVDPDRIQPSSGAQLYQQRWMALRSGTIYTRLPASSFHEAWQSASRQPTYQQWRRLLRLEAQAVANGQGNNRLSVLLGDSLSLWYPRERLPAGRLWLNQGISGDTTAGILRRLGDFAQTNPDRIYVMAGINDLLQGASDRAILENMAAIVTRLRQMHPQAEIFVQSILPTRDGEISNQRIARLNRNFKAIAHARGAIYKNLFQRFGDAQGRLYDHLTTDGIHLNPQGYQLWQQAMGGDQFRPENWMVTEGKIH